MKNDDIDGLRSRLLHGMKEFMEADPDFECPYTQADIDRCAEIVDGYLAEVGALASADDAEILRTIEQTVVRLNNLNDDCGHCLIETDQREDLCELILIAARAAGLSTDDDVTENWREW